MMKTNITRKLVLLITLFVALTVCAQQVTQDEALNKAYAFMQKKRGGAKAPKRAAMRVAQSQPMKVAASNSAYYVVNIGDNEGFVIVAGDERAREILGYSMTGTFDPANAPDGMKDMLASYADEMERLAISSVKKSQKAPTDYTAIAPLIKTQWGQDEPYNWQCPMVDNQRCLSGCVATAMSQVLNYYQWPQEATSMIPGYTPYNAKSGYLPTLSSTMFQWDKMKDVYTNGYTQEEGQAVAELMQYCGWAVQMEYDLDGSGAWLGSDVLSRYFGYSDFYKGIQKFYSNKEWEQIIYNELENGRPVLYAAGNAGGRHMFICDGYDGSGLYHINWGWNGIADGFYVLDVLDWSGFDGEQYNQT